MKKLFSLLNRWMDRVDEWLMLSDPARSGELPAEPDYFTQEHWREQREYRKERDYEASF